MANMLKKFFVYIFSIAPYYIWLLFLCAAHSNFNSLHVIETLFLQSLLIILFFVMYKFSMLRCYNLYILYFSITLVAMIIDGGVFDLSKYLSLLVGFSDQDVRRFFIFPIILFVFSYATIVATNKYIKYHSHFLVCASVCALMSIVFEPVAYAIIFVSMMFFYSLMGWPV